MGKKLSGNRTQVTFQVREDLWGRVRAYASERNYTINFVLERVLMDFINSGQLPGVTDLTLDSAGYSKASVRYGTPGTVNEAMQPPKTAHPSTSSRQKSSQKTANID